MIDIEGELPPDVARVILGPDMAHVQDPQPHFARCAEQGICPWAGARELHVDCDVRCGPYDGCHWLAAQ